MTLSTHPNEGDLYKTYQVENHIFHIHYGYYAENERGRVEPLPIFPDLKKTPLFTASGAPVITSLQKPCGEYSPKDLHRKEDWCGDCIHYSGGKEELGICKNPDRIRSEGGVP